MKRGAALIGLASLLSGTVFTQGARADGAQQFEAHCAACHGSAGIGTPGLAPPLDRPDFWQALDKNAVKYISSVVTKGLNMPITVRGERYAGLPMTPVVSAKDDELAEIASWVLSNLGELDQAVTADDIATARDSDVTGDDIKALRPETE